MRLNKYIASAGVCSRRKADELIANGNVKINGAVVREMGAQVEDGDVVSVNGTEIKADAAKV
jgi:23S rRNA pseudouridine2605 synthase